MHPIRALRESGHATAEKFAALLTKMSSCIAHC